MAIRPDAADADVSLLCGDDGSVLARFRFRDVDGEQVATDVRPFAGVAVDPVAAQAFQDLAGLRVGTPDDSLADVLLAGGGILRRAATNLRHDLRNLPAVTALPVGWFLGAPRWDEEMGDVIAAAYGPGHPDNVWRVDPVRRTRDMYADDQPVPMLLSASARLVRADGRSAGHVVCAGPVPWTDEASGWVYDLAVVPDAQGLGLGRALLDHALRGVRAEGLHALGLSVSDGNPARRMYERAGFRPTGRGLSIVLPQDGMH